MSEISRATQRARLPVAIVRGSHRRPAWIFLGWLLMVALAAPGLARLQVDTSTDSVLDRADPAWAYYQLSQERFGGDEILVASLRASTPWAPSTLREVARLSRDFEALEGVRRVDSIATVPIVHATSDGVLELDPALRTDDPDGPEARATAARAAIDRIAPRTLVSEDGRVFAINLVLKQNAEALHEELVTTVRQAVAPLGGDVSGVPVFRVATNGYTRSEVVAFAPATAVLLFALLWWVFRSATVVLLALLPGVVGALLMLAAMGYTTSPLTITTMILPSVVLALGCAYAMHFVAAARASTDAARAQEAVALPVALSGLTTGIGFGAIGLVQIEAVQFVGGFGAIGVLTTTAAALTLVPAGLVRVRPASSPPRGFAPLAGRLATGLAELTHTRNLAVLGIWVLVFAALAPGIARIQIETDATQWLPVGNPVRDAYESIRTDLSGISPVNVVFEAEAERTVTEPAVLAAIDSLSAHLTRRPDVGKTVSLADPLRQLHGGFSGAPGQPLPGDRALAEQYLLLLESVEHIEDLVTEDRVRANLLIRADHNGSSHLRRIAEDAERWWAEHGAEGVSARATGIMYEYARAEDEIAFGQLRGLAFALTIVGLLLLAIFRWPRLAAVALIPNLAPLAIVFGVMGYLEIALDAGTVLVGSLALGVAVDDTIHVLSAFVEERETGRDPRSGIERALARALPPIVYTTAIVSVAFGVLGFSEFTFTRNFGLLIAAIMTLCLVSDVTLLPALLRRLPLPGATREDRALLK